MKAKPIRTCAMLLLNLIVVGRGTAKEWYVDAHASTLGTGTAAAPFATLPEARDAIRAERATTGAAEATHVFLKGEFKLAEPVEFSSEDAGTPEAPVIWQALENHDAVLSGPQLETLISIYDCQNFTLQGLTFSGVKEQAIEVAHGYQVEINSCKVSHSEHTGIHLFGGLECSINNCLVQDCGLFGVRAEAGDRTTLEEAAHQIRECQIVRCGTAPESFAAAIYVAGVGLSVKECLIENCDAFGIRLDGNEHRISDNRLHRVCLQGHDLGAIYLGHDWTERGNIIEQNLITQTGGEPRDDAMAIYLDDFASGTIVRGNVISSAGRGIVVGGGEANEISGNLIEDCSIGLQFDDRAQTWLAQTVSDPESYIQQGLAEIAPYWGLYRNRYPELGASAAEIQVRAQSNSFSNNVLQRSGAIAADQRETVTRNHVAANRVGSRLFVLNPQEKSLRLLVSHSCSLPSGLSVHNHTPEVAVTTP
jgi:parallel beta-helix repeat protein